MDSASKRPDCARRRRPWSFRRLTLHRLASSRALIALSVVTVFAVLSVAWEVAERHFLPNMSIGTHHALLTFNAAVMTAIAGAIVYLLMRKDHLRLAKTAKQITNLLESFTTDRSTGGRFFNPSHAHCRSLLGCQRTDCVMYDQPEGRCWQVVALRKSRGGKYVPPVTIHQCHECDVYLRACPSELEQLGESFNNLMFLLEEEAQRTSRMRVKLGEKEKMVAVGQLAAGIAHEVCNPLSSISSIAQVLKRNGTVKPPTEELELIESHVRRITSTVRQLVTLAKPTAEQWVRADLGQILEEVVRLVRFDQRARNVEIVFERSPLLPETYIMHGQLHQVFINLCLNALDAMPQGGRLQVRAKEDRGSVCVEIEDSGDGIDPDIAGRVFEPFFTTKEPGAGTGLGLAVSYSIVHKHGGSLDFASTPGRGTVFSVEIPILSEVPVE